MCRGAEVVVVGGGNSAGQAAVFLAEHARRVLLLIRGDDLYKNMSSYLARRIEQTAEHRAALQHDDPPDGRRRAPRRGRDRQQQDRARSGRSRRRPCSASSGRCRGPTGCRRRSSETPRGSSGPGRSWRSLRTGPRRRQPFLLETSRPGVFAAGDVRSGSVKRVASAVGEGSMAVQFVHEVLEAL